MSGPRTHRPTATNALGINHVMLGVSDLDRSIAFYERLGFTLFARFIFDDPSLAVGTGIANAAAEIALLDRPHFRLELIRDMTSGSISSDVSTRSPFAVGNTHICLDVADVDAYFAEMKAEGVRFRGEPVTSPSGKIRFVYMVDPDGITIELLERCRTEA